MPVAVFDDLITGIEDLLIELNDPANGRLPFETCVVSGSKKLIAMCVVIIAYSLIPFSAYRVYRIAFIFVRDCRVNGMTD